MKVSVNIQNITTVDELPDYWSLQDFRNLLEELGITDADQLSPAETKEMLYMALTDLKPEEAATTMLSYRLNEVLSEGQIQQLSHEMQEDKVAEEYPDIALHYPLFNVNQLLFKAFNGKFPSTKASIIECQLTAAGEMDLTKEFLLKSLHAGLSDSSVLSRLYEDELKPGAQFEDAEKIIWELKNNGTEVTFITSDYWLNKEDFAATEFETTVEMFVEAEED